MPQGVMQARVACEHLAMCSHCEAGGAGREGKRKGGRQGRDEEAGGRQGRDEDHDSIVLPGVIL